MTTASYRAHDVDEYYGSNTVTLPAPTGLASGDVLFAEFLGNDGNRVLNTLPSGWTLIASATETAAPSTGFWLCKKVAGGSEPATYDFVFNYDFNGRVCIVAYKDGSDVSVYGAATAPSAGSTSPYDVDAAAITVPDDDSKVIFFGALRVTTTGAAAAFTPPTSYTERVDSGASYDLRALTVADITQATAGTTGAVSTTVAQAGGGAARTVGVLVAIAPSTGSTTISASGDCECPVITAVSLASVSEQIPAGNYSDVVCTVLDQATTGLAGLTGTITSSDTAVATVSQLAATDSDGEATVRITGVVPGSSSLTATFDSVESNSVAVTINRAASGTSLVTPSSVALDAGATQTFAATLSGQTADFVWTVESGGGSITSAGVYTAPNTATTAIIRATLSTDGSIYAEATVTVTVQAAEAGVVRTTWKRNRSGRSEPLAGYELDYWIISSSDTLITSGTETTDSSGTLTLQVSGAYSGQDVLVVVNNLASDMDTAGKIKGQQVVTVG
ncbi:MAG: hypothetical protein J5J04_16845 [Anaerolineae bacterium]|nr:hypothetical protein [Anaerolineae bacterium]